MPASVVKQNREIKEVYVLCRFSFKEVEEKHYDPPAKKLILVDDENGEEIGYLIFTPPQEFCRGEVHIQRLVVREPFRGKGFAKTLLRQLICIAEARYKRARIFAYITPLEAGISLSRLISLYQQVGFEVKKISDFGAEGWHRFK